MRATRPILAALAVGAIALLVIRLSPRDGGSSPRRVTLHVLAAASLSGPLREIAESFENARPGVRISVAFAGSNTLRLQLEHGAPGDVFLSADREQMDAAVAAGVVDPRSVTSIARSRLCLIVPRGGREGVASIADLARPGIRLVMADEPVPAGRLAALALSRASDDPALGPAFTDAVRTNTVSREDSVSSVVAKVALGEADAGFAYASAAHGDDAGALAIIELPPTLRLHADYFGGVAAEAREGVLAAEFLRFLAGEGASAVLSRHGIEPIVAPPSSP